MCQYQMTSSSLPSLLSHICKTLKVMNMFFVHCVDFWWWNAVASDPRKRAVLKLILIGGFKLISDNFILRYDDLIKEVKYFCILTKFGWSSIMSVVSCLAMLKSWNMCELQTNLSRIIQFDLSVEKSVLDLFT